MENFIIIFLSISITIGAYLLGRWLYNRLKTPLLIPIVVATATLVMILLIFSIDYNTYMAGGVWIHELLSPAVVALAYPLYHHRQIIRRKALPIIVGTLIGSIVGVSTGVGLALIIGIEEKLVYSIAPKSVTTPVAMDISANLGGIDSLTAVFVVFAGIVGAMLGPYVFKLFKMKTPISRGIGLGSASHAIGTSKALEYDSKTGTMSTIAMILSTLFVSVVTPPLIALLM